MIIPLELRSKGDVVEIEFLPSNDLVCVKKIGDREQIVSSNLIDTNSLLTSFIENESIRCNVSGYSIEDTVAKKTKTENDTVINDLMLHLTLNNICQKTINRIARTVLGYKLKTINRIGSNKMLPSIIGSFIVTPNIVDLIKFTMACTKQTNKSCTIRIKKE